jgi:CO dehydrogenase/acetyl-CoA synthase beta subunit
MSESWNNMFKTRNKGTSSFSDDDLQAVLYSSVYCASHNAREVKMICAQEWTWREAPKTLRLHFCMHSDLCQCVF